MNELLGLVDAPNWEFFVGLVAQVVIISYVVAWSWQRIVGTQAERLVKGVLVIAAIWGLAYLLHFTLITTLLHTFVPVALIALVIVFQPELRRGLGHLGRMRTFRLDWSLRDADADRTRRDVDQIIAAVRELSRSKTGALIVIEPSQGERDYVSPGTTMNADITTTLLLTIFFQNSPLHDGAVVIRLDKIVAAGVILPMTDDPQLSYRYGTRHRAAIGLSETYDGLCIVVSEETGAISAASRGMLARYKSADDLREPIVYLYTHGGDATDPNPMSNFLSLFSRGSQRLESTKPETDDHHEPAEEEERHVLAVPEKIARAQEKTERARERGESQDITESQKRKAREPRRKLTDTHSRISISQSFSTTDDTSELSAKKSDSSSKKTESKKNDKSSDNHDNHESSSSSREAGDELAEELGTVS